MERQCKNCNELIYAGKSHCSNCGCKWIEKRITMKQVAHDFGDMYVGIDTKFVRTFMDLFIKPEAVILGYMNGRRVNYMDAIRYLLLALFVTGIYTFVLKNTGAFENIITSQEAAYE
jgi:RNA polymerase subunit RPABC4/transcription elongation factor Spt4